jgi:hypothetical protein
MQGMRRFFSLSRSSFIFWTRGACASDFIERNVATKKMITVSDCETGTLILVAVRPRVYARRNYRSR